jgi:hypothetical protein
MEFLPGQPGEEIDYLFFADFLADDGELFAAGARCALGSGTFANVMICVWLFTGALGRAGSSSCSSPNPID